MARIIFLLSFVSILFFCFGTGQLNAKTKGEKTMKITMRSSAFEEGGMIPKKYTCDDANVSPPLSWNDVPEGTKSLALICDDPDAPMGTWVHWVLYDLPPTNASLLL